MVAIFFNQNLILLLKKYIGRLADAERLTQ